MDSNKILQENSLFLPSNGDGKELKKTRRCTKKKICCICCLSFILVSALVVGGGLLYLYSRESTLLGDAGYWESVLNVNVKNPNQVEVSGRYELVSVDEHYQKYLEAMGVPFFVLPLLAQASETHEISIPEGDNPLVAITTKTDWDTTESEFHWGEEFSMEYGGGSMTGTMFNNCTRPQHNILYCMNEERDKGWMFTNELVYTNQGLVMTRNFLGENIITKKYYLKEGVDIDMDQLRAGAPEDVETVAEVEEDYYIDEEGWIVWED